MQKIFTWRHQHLIRSIAEARKLEEKIKKKGGAGLKGIKNNLVDEVWGDARPSRPQEKVRTHSLEYSGKALGEKIEELRKELDKKKSAGFVICRPQSTQVFSTSLALMFGSYARRSSLAVQPAGKRVSDIHYLVS